MSETLSLNQPHIPPNNSNENITIHKLFEEKVINVPNNVAIICDEVKLTYNELNQRANQLANYLQKICNVESGELIALYLEKNEYSILAILAVLKIGCGYIPIDPECSDERISYILKDTSATLLLTNQHLHLKLSTIVKQYKSFHPPENQHLTDDEVLNILSKPILIKKILAIDSDILQKKIIQQSITNPKKSVSTQNIAYGIYTSGTTGMPKCVLLPHSNVVRLFTITQQWYNFNDKDVWVMFHSYVFDFTVWEIWELCFMVES